MTSKGQYVRGVDQLAAKLQDDDVVRMRELARDTELTLKQLGAEFGVTAAVAWRVVTGRGWSHVEGPTREPRSYTKREK
ncbi:helix-turn-helix DNA binding domain protein [Arthrobacter phage Pippa]|nr:helix-turn-helix DNA binding domain protein [Arthrobacter phage Pippa]